MNRQVDVKALVSHVIRGDGVNKCRICMGDTSEGQVYLSDTVIMEGDKPVTLSELLEVVTGIQVPLDGDLPAGVCVECSACAVNAANFRAMCRETSSKWHMTLQLLCDLPSQFSEKDKILFVIMDDNQMILVIDEDELMLDTASERLGTHLSTQINMNSLIDVKSDGKVQSNNYNDILDTRERNENEIKEVIEDKTLVARRVKTKDGVPKRGKNVILDTKIVEKEDSVIKCVYENEGLEMKRVSRGESELKDVKDKRLVTKKEESEQKYLIKTERLSIQMPQCPNCNKKFLNPLKLYHHLRGSIDMTRACHICCEIMNRDELVSHLNEVHNIEVFDCKKCPAVLLTKNKYIQHLNKAHAHGACSCIDCGQTFQSHQAFNAHMSVHRRKSCPSCDKIFQNQTCYLYHVKKCNLDKNIKTKMRVEVKNLNSKRNVKVGVRGSTDNVCICDYCGKRFAKKKYVTAHIQIVHMKNTHAPCAYCGKLLATAHMTEHLKKHELNLSFKCQHCGIVLKSKLGYVQHLRLHTGERPYACQICKETFSASSRRSEHMRKVHQDAGDLLKHACKLCPAKFRQPYKLKKHMKSAHVNEYVEAQTFECAECHEKFGSCRGLLHHSRTHQKVNFPYRRPEKTIMLKVFNEPGSEEKK